MESSAFFGAMHLPSIFVVELFAAGLACDRVHSSHGDPPRKVVVDRPASELTALSLAVILQDNETA